MTVFWVTEARCVDFAVTFCTVIDVESMRLLKGVFCVVLWKVVDEGGGNNSLSFSGAAMPHPAPPRSCGAGLGSDEYVSSPGSSSAYVSEITGGRWRVIRGKTVAAIAEGTDPELKMAPLVRILSSPKTFGLWSVVVEDNSVAHGSVQLITLSVRCAGSGGGDDINGGLAAKYSAN